MSKNVAVRVNDDVCTRQDAVSDVNVLTEFKQAFGTLRIHEGTAVWLFRDFMSCPAPPAIKGADDPVIRQREPERWHYYDIHRDGQTPVEAIWNRYYNFQGR